MPITPALGRLRKEDHELKKVRAILSKTPTKHSNTNNKTSPPLPPLKKDLLKIILNTSPENSFAAFPC